MRFLTVLLLAFFFNGVSASSGYIKINNSLTNKDWNFLPESPSSFDTSSVANFEILFIEKKFGLLLNRSDFELNVVRATEPKSVKLSADKKTYELFYFLSPNSAISFASKNQLSDRQFIDCYSFGSLVVGSCVSADLKISNSNAEYQQLNGSILLIDGQNESKALNYSLAIDSFIADEFVLGLEQTENQYFWITPLEGITSNFILNINVEGGSLGSFIDTTLQRLPQRTSWTTNQINMSIKKELKVAYKPLSFFYEISALFIDHGDYKPLTNIPNTNFKLTSGLKFHFQSLDFSFYGNFFQNNLLGFEAITFNQRTEHYFTQHFGSLGFEIKYNY